MAFFRSKIVGFVERLSGGIVSGWAYDRSGRPIVLHLLAAGTRIELAPHWSPRPDVGQSHGVGALNSGFSCALEGRDAGLLVNALRDDLPLRVYANGTELESSAAALVPQAPVRLSGTSGSAITGAGITSLDRFVIRGWVEAGPGFDRRIDIAVQGAALLGAVVWCARGEQDVLATDASRRLDFEVTLPGYLWEFVDEEASASILVAIAGHPLAQPLSLSRGTIARWIEEIFEIGASGDWQAQQSVQQASLTGLEHLRFSAAHKLLPPRALRQVYEFAATMALADYLPAASVEADMLGMQSFSQLVTWKALRALNDRLLSCHASREVFDAVVSVMRDFEFAGAVRDAYLSSAFPLLCRHDAFAQLREVTDFTRWYDLEFKDDAWALTTVLPALVADGHISRATDVLYRLSQRLGRGWVSTECVHFAVRDVNRQLLSGKEDATRAEKFGYALLAVFDGFNGDWFSRLHDLELVRAAVAMIELLDLHADYFRHEVISALVRNFGLVPEFWRVLDQAHPLYSNPELGRARLHWGTLRSGLGTGVPRVGQVHEITLSFRYFIRHRNREAIFMLREIVMNRLVVDPDCSGLATHSMIELLLEDPLEGIRLAAFPFASRENLLDRHPETGANLLQTLRALHPHPRSSYYESQAEAGRLIAATELTLARAPKSPIVDAVSAVRRIANALDNWPSHFLSIDLLAWCYSLRADRHARDVVLMSTALGKVIADCNPEWFLPVAAMSALMRLSRLSGKDHVALGFVAEMRKLIDRKFGDRHDFLFDATDQLAFGIRSGGLHADTLVVIYSCRKYLDTRVASIRSSWLLDLRKRGIPYLVVVGDGNDTIEGDDVLALDVSDAYEHLPQKTLRLFDWVLKHTDFQHVYKIDDDCYLDVARFFDTLTYRKHHYYGRVIQRGVGATDRTWHQSKSNSAHAQKTLDKSPDPSRFADGGGGYVLSRLSMHMLGKSAASEAGQRLVAVSLMEDKLVGDLLSLARVWPSDEDYESYQRRRTHATAVPVGMHENTFYPGVSTPTMMTHLDTDRDMAVTAALQIDTALWPKKLWPTSASLLLHPKYTADAVIGSNQLELLGDIDKLRGLLAHPLALVAVMRNEMTLLPHFLEHYRSLGVCCFLIVDNLSDDGSREYLLQQPDVALFSADTEYRHSHFGVAWQQALLGNFCLGKWVLLVDADEFLVYPHCETMTLPDFVSSVEQDGFDAVRTDLIDMYPYYGIEDADFMREAPFVAAPWFDSEALRPWRMGRGFYSNLDVLTSGLRHRLLPEAEPHAFSAQKFALFRYLPWVRVSEGVHDVANINPHPVSARLAHFKYHAGTKLKIETEIRRSQHFDNAREYRRYAALLAESRGGFGAEEISVRYADSRSFSQGAR